MTWDPLEREVEAAVRDLFLKAGWYPVKTDAAMVTRGSGRGRVKRGHIEAGFPDFIYLFALPGLPLALAAVVELKSPTGELRDDQMDMHRLLRDLYRLTPHVVRSADDALHLIQAGLELRRLLKIR